MSFTGSTAPPLLTHPGDCPLALRTKSPFLPFRGFLVIKFDRFLISGASSALLAPSLFPQLLVPPRTQTQFVPARTRFSLSCVFSNKVLLFRNANVVVCQHLSQEPNTGGPFPRPSLSFVPTLFRSPLIARFGTFFSSTNQELRVRLLFFALPLLFPMQRASLIPSVAKRIP